jgi:hypothetical protein
MAAGMKTGGGSRKGSPNKNTKAIKDMILGALAAKGGQEWLEAQMDSNPTAFMTLLGKVLPTQIQGDPENPLRIEAITKRIIDPKHGTGN